MNRIHEALSHDFAYHDLSHMMIFAANHDTERIGSIVGADIRRMKMITALLATLRGLPQTYSGDEQMFLSTNDSGDSAWRCEFPGGWEGDSINLFTAEGRSAEQNELFDYNRRLWQWRKSAEVIHRGRTLHFIPRDNAYGYFRYLTADDDNAPDARVSKAVFVFINNSDTDRQLPWSYYDEFTPRLAPLAGDNPAAAAKGTDVLTGQAVTLSDATVVPAGGTLVVEF